VIFLKVRELLVKVTLLPKQHDIQEIELNNGATGEDLLEKLNLTFDAHIITRENQPIPLDEELNDDDNIGIIKVVSGG
jgi:sulfur carrier protein ThiS